MRSTDILIYIGHVLTTAIIVNESLVSLNVYEGVYLLAFTKSFEALWIHRDINHRSLVKFERRLPQADKKELEIRIQERTLRLETANKELESFAYSVSHDLRSPLRGIDGFSLILLEEYPDKLLNKQGQNYLQKVQKGALRMSQLIDDMLNLSKVSRSELNIRQINLNHITLEVISELWESNLKRNVKFIIQKEIIANVDENLLRVVLENLIGNAWKFTIKHPTALIEFGSLQRKEKLAYFVRDDGDGFEMKSAQKLFGTFQHLHDSNEFKGTSIGLTTAQQIIHRHEDSVWAEEEVEKGLHFILPLKINTIKLYTYFFPLEKEIVTYYD